MKEHIFNDQEREGQRLDNWLIREYKGVPKSRIQRAVRSGEVRINGKRVKSEYKLAQGDRIRMPPLRQGERASAPRLSDRWKQLEKEIIYEDSGLIIINKPSGIPVHGGTGQNAGIIEALRELRPQQRFLELVHRLDRPTSGCLLIAKKRSYLTCIQEQFTKRSFKKKYLMLVEGAWPKTLRKVELSLKKNVQQSGERMVKVDAEEGKAALTEFEVLHQMGDLTLIAGYPKTGRTHQLRVHTAAQGHPIVGDEKYGSGKKAKRLMLHAASVDFYLPDGERVSLCAVLPPDFGV